MKVKSKKILITSIIVSLIIITGLFALISTTANKKMSKYNAELLRAMSYEELKPNNMKIKNCDYVQFGAFFARDLDDDGIAEKLLGSCKNVKDTDQLYIDLNVLSKGYLKDGVITINGTNFNYSMNMVKDSVLANTYISEDVEEIMLNQVNAGTQKLIIGNILPDLQNNINNYSKISSITLEGTYVAEDGVTETKISKTIDITVDWYGTIEADLYENYEVTTFYYNYKEVDATIGFEFRIDELKKELILKENVVKATIPELKGYAPTKVECTNGNVEVEYDEQTRVITIRRNSILTEEETAGQVINTLARNNTYNIEVTYPQEAFDSILSYEEIKVPVEGYYVGYNNNNEEFQNPYTSNVITGNLTLVFRDIPEGEIYDFEVEFMDKSAVTRPDHKYVISKQDIINMYDNNQAIANKKYEVRWIAKRGTVGEVTATSMSETKEEAYGDKWNDTIMAEYVSNTGIYFQNADEALGKDGKIFVYNNDTDELIKIFDKEEWSKYTKSNPYKYENEVKHIRVETTNVAQNTIFMIFNIKEMNMEKILEDFTKEDIQNVETIYTYLTATCDIKDQEPGEVKDIDYATYVSDKSYASINLRQDELETQETYENTITINAQASQVGDAKWINGIFLVEIPEEIISMEIKDVSINNAKVGIAAYDLYKEDGKYFIKVITENEEPEKYKITIKCTMTPDPRTPSSDREVKLYAYNENCNDYYYETIDTYDVDGDIITQEEIGTNKAQLRLLSPTSLITLETISNYNDKGEITIAPNVADIEKDTNTATVNIELTNNYPNAIGTIKTLGKIPFEGNTYVLNKETLGSDFSTTMTNAGIQVPEELEGKAVVYYSTKENPTQDIQNSKNGWTLLENVDDFSKIKTYLIDLKDSEIKTGETYTFSYNINVPQGVEYNKVTYSDHAVYFELKTDNGNIQLSTEPNKVGIRIARKYNLEITKYKEETTLGVPGCIYKLVELDEKGNEVSSRILTTNITGKMTANGIYVDKTYKLKEIRSSKNYSLNTDEIIFKVVEDKEGNLKFEKISDTDFASAVVLEKNEEGEDVLTSTVEDKAKYSITISKIDETTKEAIRDVYFRVEEIGRTYITNDNGYVTIENLEQDIEYTLVETKAEGYYLPEEVTFKLVKDDGKLVVESNNANLKQAVIENSDTEHVIKVEANITNEKIPTFNLQVLKVEKTEDETQEQKTLQGAEFKLTSKDTEKEKTYTTDKNGNINISDLYIYEEGREITGEYTLTETKAPEGYVNNAEEIKFKVTKDADDKLTVNVLNSDDVKTLKKTETEENTVKFIIEDKPLFRLVKTDEATGEKLKGVEFVIYELNEDGEILGFAKDVNGNEVGSLNDKNQYVVVTDDNGSIALPLKDGKYKAIEVKQLEGYEETDGSYLFDVSEKLNASENTISESDLNIESDTDLVLEIKTAEDLIAFANRVNSGETFDGQLVVLANTIDLENQEFTPIGTSANAFMGTFDGQGYEIRNINVKNDETAALFGQTKGAVIKNVGVTGNITGKSYVASIVAQSTGSAILNSYSKVNITVEETTNTHYVGGIVGEQLGNSIVYNCYNEGTISTENVKVNGYIGGLVGTSTSSKIISSYNKGAISLKGYLDIELGGILGKSNSSEVTNCFNEADINIERLEGGNGSYYVGGIVGNGGTILNSYNTGKITNNAKRENSYIYLGGIAGSSNKVENSYNKGEIHSSAECSSYAYISGITNSFGSATITNCYNTADIYNYSEGNSMCYAYVNGIGQGTINKCFNTGDIFNTAVANSGSTTAYVSGIGQNSTVSNSYNNGDILNIAKDYAYGTTAASSGIGYNTRVTNCYNIGNITNNANSYGYYTDGLTSIASPLSNSEDVENSYYLENITLTGNTISTSGTKVTEEELKTEKIYNQINKDNVWLRYEGVYPRLSPMSQVEIIDGIELNIKNTKKAYKITTTVDGIGGKITGENEQPFEIVEHGKDGTKEIKAEPDKNFEIEKITINGKEIEFTVLEDGTYIIPAEEFKTMQEDKHVVVKFKGKDNFTISKKDEETNAPIPNTKFVIYSVTAAGEITDFAKNMNNQYIGELNDEWVYEIKTDENGKIELALPIGYYKAVEVQAAEGYKLPKDEEERTTYFKIGIDGDFVITHIEDLVDLSNRVNAGETFEGKTVVLANSIDFEDPTSYRNPEDTENYGDYNGDGTVGSIKEELTTGSGFKSIGTSNSFMGIFDGKGNKIRNINDTAVVGLVPGGVFGNVKSGTIVNLGVEGGNTREAGIAYSISNSKIINCYNSSTVSGYWYAGGIVQYAENSEIINCYNSGVITSNGGYGSLAWQLNGGLVNNAYYLRTKKTSSFGDSYVPGIYVSNNVTGTAEEKTQVEMQSQEFANLLNSNRNSIDTEVKLAEWKYNEGGYPTLINNYTADAENENIEVTITNIKKTYNMLINKVDEETNAPIQNAKFAIYSVDANGEVIDFAKDINGAYIGEQNDEEIYVVSTDENGQIKLMLPDGFYKAVEIEAAEGYKLEENEENRIYFFGIGKGQEQEINSEAYSLDWAKTIKSDLDAVYESVIPTEDGGVIAVGTTFGNTDLDGDGYPDVIGKGNEEGIIVKYAENGKVEWTKLLTGINSEKLYSIAKDPNGGYVIAGSTSSTEVYLDTAKIGTKYSGNEDGIIVKIDDDGRYLWCQSIGGTGIDRVNSVAISEYGEIAVTGSYTSTEITVDKQATESLTNVGAANKCKNAFIVVYSNDGEYLWSQNVGADKDTTGASIVATNNGFAVAVNSNGKPYLNKEQTEILSTNRAGIVCFYDTYGEFLWVQVLAGPGNISIKQIITDKDGNIVICGVFGTGVSLDWDAVWRDSKGLFDGIIVKYTEDGEYVINRTISGTQDEVISSVAVTEDGGLLLGGWTYSTAVDLNNDGKNEISENLGNSDAIIMKLDSDLKLEWYDTIKGEGFDSVKGVVETSKNNYIAVGDFNSSNATVDNKQKALKAVRLSDGFIVNYAGEIEKPEIKNLEELNIENSIKEFKITTEIAENSHNRRIGGTTNGINNVDYDYLKIIERVVEGNNSTQEIIIMPKDGYALSHISINGEKIPFTPGENGGVVLPAEYFKNVTEDKHIVVTFEPNTNFVITKVDKDTNEPIEDTKFAIYKVDSFGNTIGFAKDVNNEYIGEKNDDKIYVIPTDENGKLNLALPGGYYKAVEIEAGEGYILPKDEKERTTYFKVEGKPEDFIEADFVISYIEDLVELSNRVNAGEIFEGKTVILANTIDFEEPSSYRNAEDTETYGDYNGDGKVQTIKEELTIATLNGFTGFKAIGTGDNPFMGTFDGKGNEIRNIYMNRRGLFNVVESGEILNLGIAGRVAYGSAGIAGIITNTKIINCYNTSRVMADMYSSGIVYNAKNSEVVNCFNTGVVEASVKGYGIAYKFERWTTK